MIRILSIVLTLVVKACALAATVNVNTQESSLNWEGRKVTGAHTGTILLKSGRLSFKNKKLTGGNFVVDMTSLKDEDISDPEYNAKLVGHLKSDDFFSVEKHPTSTLKITKVESGNEPHEYSVTGNLSIKGITQKVTFPATVTEENGKVTATATLEVDRTKFNIKYRSASFFEGLGDKVIKDNFKISAKLEGAASK